MPSWFSKALIDAGSVADDDRFHVGDASAPAGTRDRTITVAELKILLGGGAATQVLATSADHTLVVGDDAAILEVDATAGPVTITLPAGLDAGFQVAVVKVDATSNAVTLAAGPGASVSSATSLEAQWAAVSAYNRGGDAWATIGTDSGGGGGSAQQQAIVVACSDETTDLTTGVAKVTFRMPFAATLDAIKADVTSAPTGGPIQVDMNEEGTSVLSTPITIDAGEDTSATAATPPVIGDSALADNAKITIDVDAVGSTTPGAGLKVTLLVTPT